VDGIKYYCAAFYPSKDGDHSIGLKTVVVQNPNNYPFGAALTTTVRTKFKRLYLRLAKGRI